MENLTSNFDYLFEPDYRPTPGSLWERTIVYNDNGRLLERRDVLEYVEWRKIQSYAFYTIDMSGKKGLGHPLSQTEVWGHTFKNTKRLQTGVWPVGFDTMIDVHPEHFPVTNNPNPRDGEYSFITYKPLP